jgi:hypothetical protein
MRRKGDFDEKGYCYHCCTNKTIEFAPHERSLCHELHGGFLSSIHHTKKKGLNDMDNLERSLRATMGDANFEAAYRSAFGRLRADRYGDYPLHSVTLRMVQELVNMQNGEGPSFMPYGAPGVPTPEPDSVRIIQGSGSSASRSGGSSGSSNSSSSGGCYIATAVYGSYDCPQVWTLRRYRDNTLAKTWYGRSFVRMYYAISPTLVKWFGNTTWFNRLWISRLDRFIARLQQEGIAKTPYED